jgi:hypothetical protein
MIESAEGVVRSRVFEPHTAAAGGVLIRVFRDNVGLFASHRAGIGVGSRARSA